MVIIYSKAKGQVTYTVTVPAATHACFIAGEMTGWNQVQMTEVSTNEYTITISPATTAQQYKYCSGPSWNYTEVLSNGGNVPNRSYTAHDQVAAWAAVWNSSNNFPPSVSSGTARRHWFHSLLVDDRYIDVWLPNGYNTSVKYDVLYMHDGQMLFDASTTWNGEEWDVDGTMGALLTGGKIRPTIVVGIFNNGNKRHAEYFPEKVINTIPQPEQSELESLFSGSTRGDAYLKFIVTELKPFIDSTYSTNKDKQGTFIAGSSMGGLISLYAFCEYPDIFSGAACLSTHWIGTFSDNDAIPNAIITYMSKALPPPNGRMIYFDHGTAGLDAMYGPHQQQVDNLLAAKGYTATNWETQIFPGADHNENYWKARFHISATFLLSDKTQSIRDVHNQANSDAVKIYPNPTRSMLTVENPDGNSERNIRIFDITGREVLTAKTKSNNIDVSHLPAGIYFVHIQGKEFSVVKFIKY
jgi:enterochelin esterase-like enzyme